MGIAFGFKVATDLVIMKLFPCSLLAGFLTILLANISGSTPTAPACTQDEVDGMEHTRFGCATEARRLGNTRQLDFEVPSLDYNEARRLGNTRQLDFGLGRIIRHGMGPL